MLKSTEEDYFSIFKIINTLKTNWYWFLISIIFFSFVSFTLNRYVPENYLNQTTIHLESNNANINPLSELVNETSKFSTINFTDQILFISSYPIIYKTLESLNYNISYFIQGDIKTVETSTWRPITFIPYNLDNSYGLNLEIKVIDTKSYKIRVNDESFATHNFGDIIAYDVGHFKIEYNQDFIIDKKAKLYPTILVKWTSLHSITKKYKKKLVVDRLKDASILNLSIKGQSIDKETDFLNKLSEIYINNNLNLRNKAFSKTIQFIDNQLIEIKDSLNFIESKLQDFKRNNNISKIDSDAERFYQKIGDLQIEKSRVIIEQKYFDYLINYLSEKNQFSDIIIPSVYGIENVVLSNLSKKLIDLQLESNYIDPKGNVSNPIKDNIDSKIQQVKNNILQSVNSQKATNNILLDDLNTRIDLSENMLSSLPLVERQLINIERHYKLSESIYLFLMQKRTETGILSASNISIARVLEPAIIQNAKLISPNKRQNYLLGILLGFLIPILFFTLKEVLNKNIMTLHDIKKYTTIPFIGSIGRNFSGNELVVLENTKSSIAEAFRSIRSNVEFIINNDNDNDLGKLILITSSVSGEGKTFCVENLASLYSIAGKKTVIIGADLRKPRIYKVFKTENTLGLSNYLSGTLSYEELILDTGYDNLSFINSGPNPPNPSELLENDRMNVLINKLKKEYDYIIIDTPPICLVSDALSLIDKVDITIYITRQNYTSYQLLSYVDEMYKAQKIKNISILMNEADNTLGYGYNYSYGGYSYMQYSNGYYKEDTGNNS